MACSHGLHWFAFVSKVSCMCLEFAGTLLLGYAGTAFTHAGIRTIGIFYILIPESLVTMTVMPRYQFKID